MTKSLRAVPRRVLGVLLVVSVLLGLLLARGCVALISRGEETRTTSVYHNAIVKDGTISVDMDIARARDCPAQATYFLRRWNVLTGRRDKWILAVANTTVSDASEQDTLHFQVPAGLDLQGGPWSLWFKAQDDCGVADWLISWFRPTDPSLRESRDIPLTITPADTRGALPLPWRDASERP